MISFETPDGLFGPRPLTPRQARSIHRRRLVLEVPELRNQLQQVRARVVEFGPLPPAGGGSLILRHGFSYRRVRLDADASDRSAPARAMRPPATRLIASQGSKLAFFLTLVEVAQRVRRTGTKANLLGLGLPIVGDSSTTGWSDFVASSPAASTGAQFTTPRVKRANSVTQYLASLESAGLVALSQGSAGRRRYDGFTLLNEEGRDAIGELEEYEVPRSNSGNFRLPVGFMENSWVHVLADTEIAVILMIACRQGSWAEGTYMVMPSATRLQQYGIQRDPYSSAIKTLEWLGLIEVVRVDRHRDGKAIGDAAMLDRLRIRTEGFEKPAVEQFISVFGEVVAQVLA